MTMDRFFKVRLWEGAAYLTSLRGDIYRVSLGSDGLPLIERIENGKSAETADRSEKDVSDQ